MDAASTDGSANQPSGVIDLLLTSGKTSPALLSFQTLDAEQDRVSIEITWSTDGGATRHEATLVAGAPSNQDTGAASATTALTGLASDNVGVRHYKLWDFTADGFDASTIAAVQVGVAVKGQAARTLDTYVGNEPPLAGLTQATIAAMQAEAGVSGIVNLGVFVVDEPTSPGAADYEHDDVRVKVQYRLTSGPAGSWLEGTQSTSDSGAGNELATSADGSVEDFFWQTADANLDEKSSLVNVRLFAVEVLESADDTPASSETIVEDPDTGLPLVVRIDNNFDPVAVFENDLFVVNPDARRGIPIPFSIFDEESHDVDVLIQWRRESEEYPPLGDLGVEPDLDILTGLVALPPSDPIRREKQLATPLPRYFYGDVEPLPPGTPDATRKARLDELASNGSPLVRQGLADRWLEVLRPNTLPRAVNWESSPLVGGAVDAEPLPPSDVLEGGDALVLDGAGNLLRVRTASGSVAASIGPLAGTPHSLAVSPSHGYAFVGIASSGSAHIDRVRLDAGGYVVEDSITISSGAPTGLIALSDSVALVVANNELHRVRFAQGEFETLLTGLTGATGLALDPLDPSRAFLSETGANRVLAVDLETYETHELDVGATPGLPLTAPRALTTDRDGQRLYIVSGSSPAQLVVLSLGSAPDQDGDGLADPHIHVVDTLTDENASFSTGSDGVFLRADASGLAVGGGILQRRRLESYDPVHQIVTTQEQDGPFLPALVVGTPWRIGIPAGRTVSGSPAAKNTFLWDSRDVIGGGRVRLRILVWDTDIGEPSEGLSSKSVRAPLNPEDPWISGELNTIRTHTEDLAPVDLDGDGDLDLVAAEWGQDNIGNIGALEMFVQRAPGEFELAVVEYDGYSELDPLPVTNPISVDAADLDGDGFMDVVVANSRGENSNKLIVLRGQAPSATSDLRFAPEFVSLGGQLTSVRLIDATGDGQLDIVNGNLANSRQIEVWQDTGSGWDSVQRMDASLPIDNPRSIVLADMTGDGTPDLISANSGTDNVSILPGGVDIGGSLGFSEQPIELGPDTPPYVDPFWIACGDLDDDGDREIVCATKDGPGVPGRLVWYEQLAPSSFSAARWIADAAPGESMGALALMDVNRDGLVDILVTGTIDVRRVLTIYYQRLDSQLGRVFELDANGQFNKIEDSVQPMAMKVLDLDGNGGVDVVLGDEYRGVSLYLNEGLGEFTEDQNGLLQDPLFETEPTACAVGDFDNDGASDLVVANDLTSNLTIFRQEAPGVFSSTPRSLELATALKRPVSLVATDIDADGLTDIVIANRGFWSDISNPTLHGGIVIVRQDPVTGFDAAPLPVQWVVTPETKRIGGVRVRDLDGDGLQDLVFIGTEDEQCSFSPECPPLHRIGVFYQEPDGSFAATPIVILDSQVPEHDLQLPGSLRIADIDSDGRLDLLLLNRCRREVRYVRQTATRVFDTPGTSIGRDAELVPGEVWWPNGLSLGDMDGDGDLDLVVTSEQGIAIDPNVPGSGSASCPPDVDELHSGLAIFYQSGGAFSSGAPDISLPLTTDGFLPTAARPVDFDLDGDLDLIVSSAHHILTLRQVRPGLFIPEQILHESLEQASFRGLHIEDLDGDGDRDAVFISKRLDYAAILFGNH